MKKIFYAFALLAVSLMSCESSSDDESNPLDTSGILMTKVDIVDSDGETETLEYTYSGMTLIKEESSDGYYTDYIYEENKLTEINYYDSPNPEILESYTYDAQGRIATITTNIVDTGVYEYSLSYSNDNSVISETSITFPGGEPSVTTLSNGNMISESAVGEDATAYTHDNKNAPFKNIDYKTILLSINSENGYNYLFNANNILTEVTTSSSFPENITYTYTYTNFDFPRIKTENDEGDIITYTYTYNND